MYPPPGAIENSLVSATQAARDSLYRETLWACAGLTGMAACAALSEWLRSGAATILGDFIVLMASASIYARAALALRTDERTDALVEFLTSVVLVGLSTLAVFNGFARYISREPLEFGVSIRLFSLMASIEFVSILMLLEHRPSITSIPELFRPRLFAWIAYSALPAAGMSSVLAASSPVDGLLGLGVALMCFWSATNCIRNSYSRLKA